MLEDCVLTKYQKEREKSHFVRKLVSISTNGVALFSILAMCSPTRNGEELKENQRCDRKAQGSSLVTVLQVGPTDFPRRVNMEKILNEGILE